MSYMQVDKHVAIPEKVRMKYPFLVMEIGDSFVVKIEHRNSIGATISKLKKTKGLEFITQTRFEHGMKVLRIWRTA